MSDAKQRVQVFPSQHAMDVLGIDAEERGLGGALTHAIECWAEAMRRVGAEVAGMFSRQAWCLLADVLNGTWTLDRNWTGHVLAIEVSDAARLDGAGEKWFGKGAELKVKGLVVGLADLDFVQAHAVLLAVRWFWEHHEKIDIQKDDWWTPAFRARFGK
jgi:hypothetical protein